MFLEYLKTQIEKTGLSSLQFVACSEEEIDLLEHQLQLSLPEAYKDFLRWMGKSGGPLLKGSECFYKDLPQLQKWAVDLLKENNFPIALPNDAFVFFMHQGYQFAFMRTSEGENPPVYYYNETQGLNAFTLVFSNFSLFLDDTIKTFMSSS